MNGDFRVSVGLPQHPKVKKLMRRAGEAACWRLVCLFAWAAANRPSGDLVGMTDEDIVFIPKRRKKRVFGVLRRHLGEVFHELASHKESKIVEGHLMGDHVHICISIPPKYAVSNVVGYLKGKSAIQIARKFGGRQKNFTGEHFWARGYFVSTVGLDENLVRAYIRNQEEEDERYDQMKLAMG